MSQYAYIPHGDHTLDPDQAAIVEHRLVHEWDAADLIPMILGDEPRWTYDPIHRTHAVVKARPKSGARRAV